MQGMYTYLIQIIHKLTVQGNAVHSVSHVSVVPEAHGWLTDTAVCLIRKKIYYYFLNTINICVVLRKMYCK